MSNASIDFFETQFRRQSREGAGGLNPFEAAALPLLHGRVLDLGCGLGHLALAAARQGCAVLALDASASAVAHLQRAARDERLPVDARRVELRDHHIEGEFDAIVSIGLLMFFDCAAAARMLEQIRRHVAPGGVAAVNVLVAGTTYMEMFEPAGYCLLARGTLREAFAGWQIVHDEASAFDAAQGTRKVFETVIARQPASASPRSGADERA